MTAADLATRLLGKPVTPERIAKVPRQITSLSQYQAFLQALPEDVRSTVDAQIGAMVAQRFR